MRVFCIVPHCPRSRKPHPKDPESPEWICGDHWVLVPKVKKQALNRAYRNWKKEPIGRHARNWWILWQNIKRHAIETALGI